MRRETVRAAGGRVVHVVQKWDNRGVGGLYALTLCGKWVLSASGYHHGKDCPKCLAKQAKEEKNVNQNG